jgi:c-di-GMP-binding flagellar brake protein YcgR
MDTYKRLIGIISAMSKAKQKALLDELIQREASDKRKHTRQSYPADVNYAVNSEEYQGIIKDISAGGALVETLELKEAVATGDPVLLTIPSMKRRRYFKIKGEVVRLSDTGFAVEFTRG